MHFINCSYNEFVERIRDKRVIQFGASTGWEYYISLFQNIVFDIVDKTDYVVDNSKEKIGKKWHIKDRCFDVRKPEALCEEKEVVILITVRLGFQEEICRQLIGLGLPDDTECYSLQLMICEENEADNECVEHYFSMHQQKQIPPKIHSFWFSGEEKPDKYKKCIESWYRFCPSFEICEWNCDNYDVTKHEYMRQAMECEKWAFVSDYARLDVVHQYGGIYFDMDVELIAPIEQMQYATAFFCRQNDGHMDLGSGFGAIKAHPFVKELLDSYVGRCFVTKEGERDMTPQPMFLNSIFRKHGIERSHDSQVVQDMLLLSNDYFTCVKGAVDNWKWKGTELGIHWHNAGWLSQEQIRQMQQDESAREVLVSEYFKMSEWK